LFYELLFALIKMEKCYANSLGGCSGKLSGEHIVSKGILEEWVDVIGFSWCKDEVKRLHKLSLVSNILCEVHNWALSPFDAELKQHKEYVDLIPRNEVVFQRNHEMIETVQKKCFQVS